MKTFLQHIQTNIALSLTFIRTILIQPAVWFKYINWSAVSVSLCLRIHWACAAGSAGKPLSCLFSWAWESELNYSSRWICAAKPVSVWLSCDQTITARIRVECRESAIKDNLNCLSQNRGALKSQKWGKNWILKIAGSMSVKCFWEIKREHMDRHKKGLMGTLARF